MDLEPADIQVLIISFLFSVPILVFLIITQWKIFEKAGEHGWAVFVPFYNAFVMFKIAFGKGGYIFLIFIPVVGQFLSTVLIIALSFKLAKAFGKGTGFGFGLLFLPFIFDPILAFGDAIYVGPDVGPGLGSGQSFSGGGHDWSRL